MTIKIVVKIGKMTVVVSTVITFVAVRSIAYLYLLFSS